MAFIALFLAPSLTHSLLLPLLLPIQYYIEKSEKRKKIVCEMGKNIYHK
jgi:hypothetical protein